MTTGELLAEPSGVRRVRNPRRNLRFAFDAIIHLVGKEYRSRHRKAYLGWLWSIGQPLLMFGAFGFFFSKILTNNIENFPAFLFAGIVLFTWFSKGVTSATMSVLTRPDLVYRNNVPLVIAPVVAVLNDLIDLLFALPIALAITVVSGISIGPVILFLPLLLFVHFVFTLGLGLICCTANIFARDVRLALDVVLLGWMYATPLFYDIANVPGVLHSVIRWNPMSILVMAERGVIVQNKGPEALPVAVAVAVSVAVLAIGLLVFNRNSRRFIDKL